MFSALVLYNPMLCMNVFNFRRPRDLIAAGVLAALNKGPVALLTLTSVAWAERITEMRSSKGVW